MQKLQAKQTININSISKVYLHQKWVYKWKSLHPEKVVKKAEL